jgi:hypothetical protein
VPIASGFASYFIDSFHTMCMFSIVALKKISIDMMDERAREKCLKEV